MLIKINELNVQYGNNRVLKNCNLQLDEREIVTIVGPNGSGKTTLFKSIIGTAPIKSGKVELKPNLKIGYVPQHLNIDRSLPLTVNRFLELAQNNKKDEVIIVDDFIYFSDLNSTKLVRVYDIAGRLLQEETTNQNSLQIYPTGTLMINISDDNGYQKTIKYLNK